MTYAHFGRAQKKGEPPCPLIIRVHYFQARDEILQCAMQLSPLIYDGNNLSVFADYTMAVFKDGKPLLHSCPRVKFGLLFPAVLHAVELYTSFMTHPPHRTLLKKLFCLQMLEVNNM